MQIDFVFLECAEAERASEFDMLRLAIEEGAELIWFGFGNGFHADGQSFSIDFFPADMIQSDGICGEIKGAMVPNELGPSAWPAVIQTFDTVENVKDGFAANDRERHNGRDEGAASVKRAAGMAAADVINEAVREIL